MEVLQCHKNVRGIDSMREMALIHLAGYRDDDHREITHGVCSHAAGWVGVCPLGTQIMPVLEENEKQVSAMPGPMHHYAPEHIPPGIADSNRAL